MSRSPGFEQLEAWGQAEASASRDFTVKASKKLERETHGPVRRKAPHGVAAAGAAAPELDGQLTQLRCRWRCRSCCPRRTITTASPWAAPRRPWAASACRRPWASRWSSCATPSSHAAAGAADGGSSGVRGGSGTTGGSGAAGQVGRRHLRAPLALNPTHPLRVAAVHSGQGLGLLQRIPGRSAAGPGLLGAPGRLHLRVLQPGGEQAVGAGARRCFPRTRFGGAACCTHARVQQARPCAARSAPRSCLHCLLAVPRSSPHPKRRRGLGSSPPTRWSHCRTIGRATPSTGQCLMLFPLLGAPCTASRPAHPPAAAPHNPGPQPLAACREDASLQELFAAAPLIAMMDDHEVASEPAPLAAGWFPTYAAADPALSHPGPTATQTTLTGMARRGTTRLPTAAGRRGSGQPCRLTMSGCPPASLAASPAPTTGAPSSLVRGGWGVRAGAAPSCQVAQGGGPGVRAAAPPAPPLCVLRMLHHRGCTLQGTWPRFSCWSRGWR